MPLLLENKIALIYGAGGAVGGAVSRAFAREGATVFLSGRSLGPVEAVAAEIVAGGGAAASARVDALDEDAVERHVTEVLRKTGRVDVVLNAIGVSAVQGVPLTDISCDDFAAPIATWTRAQFLTGRAAARHRVRARSGVILMLSATPARLAIALTGGSASRARPSRACRARWRRSSVRTAFASCVFGRIGSATRSDLARTSRWRRMSFGG
jgi:3-oxoacyl-[acyl-carrier protein] reductase